MVRMFQAFMDLEKKCKTELIGKDCGLFWDSMDLMVDW